MAKGRPTKWVTAVLDEPIALGKSGITIHIYDKWGGKRGTCKISVGGIRWRPSSGKGFRHISWKRIEDVACEG